MRNKRVPHVVNEKNSIVRSIAKKENTHTIVYFTNEPTPIDLNEGTILSSRSRGVKSRRKKGLMNANPTQAAAFIPGVFENISIQIPSKKAVRSNKLRDMPVGSRNKK